MKKRYWWLGLGVMLSLTGCTKKGYLDGVDMKCRDLAHTSVDRVGDDILYLEDGRIISYYDTSKNEKMPLCSLENCKHDNSQCEAYMDDYLMDATSFFSEGGKIYCAGLSSDSSNSRIIGMDNDGSNKKVLVESEHQITSFAMSNGCLVYSYMEVISSEDDDRKNESGLVIYDLVTGKSQKISTMEAYNANYLITGFDGKDIIYLTYGYENEEGERDVTDATFFKYSFDTESSEELKFTWENKELVKGLEISDYYIAYRVCGEDKEYINVIDMVNDKVIYTFDLEGHDEISKQWFLKSGVLYVGIREISVIDLETGEEKVVNAVGDSYDFVHIIDNCIDGYIMDIAYGADEMGNCSDVKRAFVDYDTFFNTENFIYDNKCIIISE